MHLIQIQRVLAHMAASSASSITFMRLSLGQGQNTNCGCHLSCWIPTNLRKSLIRAFTQEKWDGVSSEKRLYPLRVHEFVYKEAFVYHHVLQFYLH